MSYQRKDFASYLKMGRVTQGEEMGNRGHRSVAAQGGIIVGVPLAGLPALREVEEDDDGGIADRREKAGEREAAGLPIHAEGRDAVVQPVARTDRG